MGTSWSRDFPKKDQVIEFRHGSLKRCQPVDLSGLWLVLGRYIEPDGHQLEMSGYYSLQQGNEVIPVQRIDSEGNPKSEPIILMLREVRQWRAYGHLENGTIKRDSVHVLP